ncbi:MAG: hypothetical protein ACUVQ2_06125 [Dissulfurimicrobium sp.]|uniref:hypothetical protein n=1 Tax=Dissulfurimicrobium sp. TaxID=2022436 RepID=UPI00404AF755
MFQADSIKGGLGHTMGAAGLADVVIALKSLEERMVPSTVGLKVADEDASGWVSSESQPVVRGRLGMMAPITNAGFSGINTALVLSGGYGAN